MDSAGRIPIALVVIVTIVLTGPAARGQPADSPGYVDLSCASSDRTEPASGPPPDAARFACYSRVVRDHGGTVNYRGRPTVLGLRGRSLDGTTHETTSSSAYDDTIVVLTRDGMVLELAGATHPAQNEYDKAPDADHDRKGDVGMIRPGNYVGRPNGLYRGYDAPSVDSFLLTKNRSGYLPGWRDTDHDGRFSGAEKTASERRKDHLSGVLFHAGADGYPVSVGCQTLSPADYLRFEAAIGGKNAVFDYILVEAGTGAPAEQSVATDLAGTPGIAALR